MYSEAKRPATRKIEAVVAEVKIETNYISGQPIILPGITCGTRIENDKHGFIKHKNEEYRYYIDSNKAKDRTVN